MANPEHLDALIQARNAGDAVGAWNTWRVNHRYIVPDLSGIDLSKSNLNLFPFWQLDIQEHSPMPILQPADFQYVNFNQSSLEGQNFRSLDLSHADLRQANLRRTDLFDVSFAYARLTGADFSKARIGRAMFNNTDLSEVKGLETVEHTAPSSIGIETLFLSGAKIPDVFLRGCGIPDDFIVHLPALVGAVRPIQFYSCFISYSHKDEDFARRLYSRMRDANLRVWYAPEEIKGGQKIHDQIFSAIQIHDKLLLVLSENSLQSEWVTSEIRNARIVESEEKRRKLFPIRLADFDSIRRWKCFDADSGKDLAIEVREYFIPDFSNWKDHDAFEEAFKRLLRDLQTETVA